MTHRAAVLDTADTPITGDDLLSAGDVGRCELVAGRIVPMSPTGVPHAACESRIDAALRRHVDAHGLGVVLVGEVGIYTQRDPDTVRAADVLFVGHERFARAARTGYLDVAPELVVEVLSPGDARAELAAKLREYFAIGVRVVWVADPRTHTVRVHRGPTAARELGPGERLSGDDVLPGLDVAVDDLFGA